MRYFTDTCTTQRWKQPARGERTRITAESPQGRRLGTEFRVHLYLTCFFRSNLGSISAPLVLEHDESVRSKGKQLNLTDAQKDQLRERESTECAAAESALAGPATITPRSPPKSISTTTKSPTPGGATAIIFCLPNWAGGDSWKTIEARPLVARYALALATAALAGALL